MSGEESVPIILEVNPAYPKDTEVITVELELDLINNLNKMAKLSGLCTNDMIKAILGLQLFSLGIDPKE